METIDPNIVQQFLEQYQNTNNSDTSLTPTIDVFPQEFINLLSIGFIAIMILATFFLIVYIISTIRKWKVQSAVLDMHKDVKLLKDHLVTGKPQSNIDRDTSKIA